MVRLQENFYSLKLATFSKFYTMFLFQLNNLGNIFKKTEIGMVGIKSLKIFGREEQTGNPLLSLFQFPSTVPLHAFPLLIARDQQYQVVPKYSWGEEDELMTLNSSSPAPFSTHSSLFS